MKNRVDLTQGSIVGSLFKLAVPIMLTSFLQMAYNMMDMFWLGNYDSSGQAVSAAGTAGFFSWFAMAFIMLAKTGVEVKVAQSIGENKSEDTKKYIKTAIEIILVLGVFYTGVILIFKENLIGFFNIENQVINTMSVEYLSIIGFGLIFYFINPVFTAIFNGSGDSVTPLIINFIGLFLNLILDPLMINGIGPFSEMGIKGAALATIISQTLVTIIFIIAIKISKNGKALFNGFNIFLKIEVPYINDILKIGTPVAIQSGLFTFYSMLIARIISNIDPVGIGVQKVGSMIESLSWMTAGGFQTALSAFVGQNYGAQKWDRIYKGYFSALSIVAVFGIGVTCLLVFQAEPIFKLFISGEEPLKMGTIYLRILGLSQLFMCIEITTAGAFNGLGKTKIPSWVSIIFTGARVPASYFLSTFTILGIKGVWWSITMSSVFKGLILVTLFVMLLMKRPEVGIDKIKTHFKIN
ncbi:MATE family efflux transporter [Tepidibacter hydrothermalis]|uniref:Probable multidrug resistance protein NorM n=1 Tax=Tepidibacter hydrothermalis TaxID=3036126 RepID=A0ABY8EL05_9FIRM|nr:MATE family efflux transporter [Tepidibacter hydrothermalis]WFD11893.1 MATE family efflux transporter [Tepidibacter hydrothermalis]